MKKTIVLGLNPTEEKDVRDEFNSSSALRGRLTQIMRDKRENAITQNISEKSYDCPNWAYKQADLAGYMRALEEICDLLK